MQTLLNKIRHLITGNKNDFVFIFLGFLFILLRYREQIFTEWIYGPFQDGSYLLGPVFSYMSTSFSNGETPYLIGSILGGMPIYNSMHFSIYYPFYFLGLLDWGIGHEAQRMMAINSVFHFLIIFINTYVLGRVLKLISIGAFVAAAFILIAANTGKLAVWNHSLAGYAWVPLLAAGLISIFDKPTKYRGAIILAIGALGITAMPAQPLVQAVIIAIPICIVGFILTGEKKAALGKLVLGTILSFGIAAVGIIPAIIDYDHMLRFVGPGMKTVGYQNIPFDAFITNDVGHVLWKEFFICPEFLKHGPGHIYIGPLCFLLAILGSYNIWTSTTLSKISRWTLIVLGLYGVYFLLSAFGNTYKLTTLNYYIPFLNKVREPIRHGSISSITFAILAGHGASYLVSLKHDYRKIHFQNFIVFFGLVIIFTCFTYQKELISGHLGKVGLAIIASTVSFLIFTRFQNLRWPIIIAFVFLNGLIVSRGAPEAYQNKIESKSPKNLASLKLLDDLKGKIQDPNEFRIVYHDKDLNNNKFSMNSAFFGLRSFGNSFSPLPNPQAHFMNPNPNSNRNYKVLFGAKYHVYDNSFEVPKEYNKYFGNNNYQVFNNPNALPRIHASNLLKQFNGGLFKFEEHLNGINNFHKYIFLKKKDHKILRNHLKENGELNKKKLVFESIISKDGINNVKYELSTNKNTIVVFNEFYNKNWELKIDREVKKLTRCNVNQMCFPIKTGKSTVELTFKPKFFIFLRYLQLIFYLVITVLGIYTYRNKIL